jgi:hypothetical protein
MRLKVGPAETSSHEPDSDSCDGSPMTTERRNRVVVLLKVNVLAAAQTDGDVSGACYTARVVELPFVAFAQRVPQLFHFTVGLDPKPHFPRARVPQDQSPEAAERYGCDRFGARGRLPLPRSVVHVRWWDVGLTPVSQADKSFPRSFVRPLPLIG